MTILFVLKILMILFIVLFVLTVMYLIMIMPRTCSRERTRKFEGWLYAHRGLHDNASNAPENSLAAFKKAVDSGYGIELDVQLTKDGVPVVFHDYTLERATGGKGKVIDYTYEELLQFNLFHSEEKIPLFRDVLDTVDGKVPIIVEIKVEWMDLRVCKVADGVLQQYKGQYCIESFHPLVVFWYRRNRKDIVRGQLSDVFSKELKESNALYFLLEQLMFNWLSKPDFIAYNHKYPKVLARRLCRNLYKNTAVAWTIKNESDMEKASENFDLFIFDSFVPAKSISQEN